MTRNIIFIILLLPINLWLLASVYLLISTTSVALAKGLGNWLFISTWLFSISAVYSIVSLNLSIFCSTEYLSLNKTAKYLILFGLFIGCGIVVMFVASEGIYDFYRNPVFWLFTYIIPTGLAVYGFKRILTNTKANNTLQPTAESGG